MRLSLLLCVGLALAPAVAAAADAAGKNAAQPAPVEVPPPPPPPADYTPTDQPPPSSAAPTGPEVTITTKGTEIRKEYRLNGRLYMIKVIPKHGKPYYLVDRQGTGEFKRSELESDVSIPMWVIKRF
jgi:Protein of unknown function (DUF2782)